MARALHLSACALLCFVLAGVAGRAEGTDGIAAGTANIVLCRVCKRKPPTYSCLGEPLRTCLTSSSKGACTRITFMHRSNPIQLFLMQPCQWGICCILRWGQSWRLPQKGRVKDRMEGCATTTKHCNKAQVSHNGLSWNITCCNTNMCNFWEFDPDF